MTNETELLYLVISILLMLVISLVLGKTGSRAK
jgi:hypothetical protein